MLGSLENAGVDWLVFRSLLKLKKVVKFSTAVLIVIRGITQMKTNNSPSPSRPTPATSSPSSTIQMQGENIEKSGNMLIVQDSPSSCLARRLRSSAGDLLK